MRVASFNLENLGDPDETDDTAASRLTILRPQMERLDADIVCLQEVNGSKVAGSDERRLAALDGLLEETAYKAFHRVHSVDPHRGRIADKHNLVILSRWPIESHEQVWHRYVQPVDYRPVTATPAETGPVRLTWDRPLLQATVSLPTGDRLHLLNLHLRAPLAAPVAGQKSGPFAWRRACSWAEGFYMAMLKRSGQALEARFLIDQLFDADPNAQILVCGDFNAEEREVPARIIVAGVDDTGNGKLAGRSLVHLERSVPESQRYSVIHHGQKLMLDHILISHALVGRYRHFEVHNEAIGDELFGFATIGENPESYHAPVVAEFESPAGDD